MVSEKIIKLLLEYTSYSFCDIDWDFDLLTKEEKLIIGNHKNMEMIKKLSITVKKQEALKKSSQQSVDVYEEWAPNDPRNW